MSKLKTSNPVTAIAETDATGEIADIFADIRETMQLPLITSIWRILVDIEDGLPTAWNATKPLYQTGQPQAALLKMREQISLPIPEPFTLSQLACVGISQDDLPAIRAIINAYNRSNGLNLIALTALVVKPVGTPANEPVPPSPPPWPQLPPLLTQTNISADTWTLLQDIARTNQRLNDKTRKPAIATIWRHLAHWPGLLALAYTSLSSLVQNGQLQRTMLQVNEIAQTEGARIAQLRSETGSIPEDAHNLITGYANGVRLHLVQCPACHCTRIRVHNLEQTRRCLHQFQPHPAMGSRPNRSYCIHRPSPPHHW